MTAAKLDDLRTRYLDLVNCRLPQRARQVKMPVLFNHCFGRIVLDNLFGGCWYEFLSRQQPAYRQLSDKQLERAIEIGESMLKDVSVAYQLNENSLRWRGKLLAETS